MSPSTFSCNTFEYSPVTVLNTLQADSGDQNDAASDMHAGSWRAWCIRALGRNHPPLWTHLQACAGHAKSWARSTYAFRLTGDSTPSQLLLATPYSVALPSSHLALPSPRQALGRRKKWDLIHFLKNIIPDNFHQLPPSLTPCI